MAALALVSCAETVARARGGFTARKFLEDDLAGFAVGDLGGVDDAGAIFR
jgi:hypothetical protein